MSFLHGLEFLDSKTKYSPKDPNYSTYLKWIKKISYYNFLFQQEKSTNSNLKTRNYCLSTRNEQYQINYIKLTNGIDNLLNYLHSFEKFDRFNIQRIADQTKLYIETLTDSLFRVMNLVYRLNFHKIYDFETNSYRKDIVRHKRSKMIKIIVESLYMSRNIDPRIGVLLYIVLKFYNGEFTSKQCLNFVPGPPSINNYSTYTLTPWLCEDSAPILKRNDNYATPEILSNQIDEQAANDENIEQINDENIEQVNDQKIERKSFKFPVFDDLLNSKKTTRHFKDSFEETYAFCQKYGGNFNGMPIFKFKIEQILLETDEIIEQITLHDLLNSNVSSAKNNVKIETSKNYPKKSHSVIMHKEIDMTKLCIKIFLLTDDKPIVLNMNDVSEKKWIVIENFNQIKPYGVLPNIQGIISHEDIKCDICYFSINMSDPKTTKLSKYDVFFVWDEKKCGEVEIEFELKNLEEFPALRAKELEKFFDPHIKLFFQNNFDDSLKNLSKMDQKELQKDSIELDSIESNKLNFDLPNIENPDISHNINTEKVKNINQDQITKCDQDNKHSHQDILKQAIEEITKIMRFSDSNYRDEHIFKAAPHVINNFF